MENTKQIKDPKIKCKNKTATRRVEKDIQNVFLYCYEVEHIRWVGHFTIQKSATDTYSKAEHTEKTTENSEYYGVVKKY